MILILMNGSIFNQIDRECSKNLPQIFQLTFHPVLRHKRQFRQHLTSLLIINNGFVTEDGLSFLNVRFQLFHEFRFVRVNLLEILVGYDVTEIVRVKALRHRLEHVISTDVIVVIANADASDVTAIRRVL